jgi:hypothetical protein
LWNAPAFYDLFERTCHALARQTCVYLCCDVLAW